MIIGIVGEINSGKDTLAKYISEELPNSEIKHFADPLKQIISILTGATLEQLEDRKFKESIMPKEWWYWYDGEKYINYSVEKEKFYSSLVLRKPTYRYALQYIGTDLLREQFNDNVFINALFKNNMKLPCIIADVRFQNEAEAVKKRGGIIIKIQRKCKYCNGIGFHKMGCEKPYHISERYARECNDYDCLIDNDGNLKDLKLRAINLCSTLK